MDLLKVKDSLNVVDLSIFNKDLKFRENKISKYYNYLDNLKSLEFMYFFCSYYNIDNLSLQIEKIFSSGAIDFKSLNYCEKFHKICEVFSNDIKSKYKVFPKEKRLENIKKINDKQIKDIISEKYKNLEVLRWEFAQINSKARVQQIRDLFLDENDNFKFSISNNRSLVLYFRNRVSGGVDVDYLEFSIAYYILDWYVNNGFSKVFDNISVVSRKVEEYPHFLNNLFPNLNYLSVKGYGSNIFTTSVKVSDFENQNIKLNEFLFSCSIGANVVHFVDGNYGENLLYCSTPVVSESVKYSKFDNYKVNLLTKDKFILMRGIFYDKNNDNISQNKDLLNESFGRSRDRNTGDFYKIMKSVLSAVIELEENMIKQVRNLEGK